MDASAIYAYVSALEQADTEHHTELHNTRHALQVAHDTIQQKQARIEELEKQPGSPEQDAFIDGACEFLPMIATIVGDHRNAWDRLPLGAKEMVALYDKLTKMGAALRPAREEGAA